MFCSGCGSRLNDSQSFCATCGRPSGANYSAAPSTGVAPAPSPSAVTAPVAQQVIILKSAKSPGTAVVLSFFWAGLGQIYNGEIGKGIVLIILHAISWLLMFVVIGFITTPILWIYGMIDAYKTAEKINAAAGIR